MKFTSVRTLKLYNVKSWKERCDKQFLSAFSLKVVCGLIEETMVETRSNDFEILCTHTEQLWNSVLLIRVEQISREQTSERRTAVIENDLR